jgi:hypothetical protein
MSVKNHTPDPTKPVIKPPNPRYVQSGTGKVAVANLSRRFRVSHWNAQPTAPHKNPRGIVLRKSTMIY